MKYANAKAELERREPEYELLLQKYHERKQQLMNVLWDELPLMPDGVLPMLDAIPRPEHEVLGPTTSERDSPDQFDDDGFDKRGRGCSGSVGQFEIGRALGRGQFATVFACRQRRGGATAAAQQPSSRLTIKVLEKKRYCKVATLRRVDFEIRIGRMLGQHENIAAALHSIASPECVFLFAERGGVDLFAWLQEGKDRKETTPPLTDTRRIVQHAAAALAHCHAHGVAHRDVKPENLLVDEDPQLSSKDAARLRVRLIDFGVALRYGSDDARIHLETDPADTARAHAPPQPYARELVGSPGFIAPEILLAPYYELSKVDSWSLGCVTVELVRGPAWFSKVWLPPFLEAGKTALRANAALQSSLLANVADLQRWLMQSSASADGASGDADTRLPNMKPSARELDAAIRSSGSTAGVPTHDSVACEFELDEPTASARGQLPSDLVNFVSQALEFLPASRASAAELHKHPWLHESQLERSPERTCDAEVPRRAVLDDACQAVRPHSGATPPTGPYPRAHHRPVRLSVMNAIDRSQAMATKAWTHEYKDIASSESPEMTTPPSTTSSTECCTEPLPRVS